MIGGKMIYVNPTLVQSKLFYKTYTLNNFSDFIGRIGAYMHEIKHDLARTNSPMVATIAST